MRYGTLRHAEQASQLGLRLALGKFTKHHSNFIRHPSVLEGRLRKNISDTSKLAQDKYQPACLERISLAYKLTAMTYDLLNPTPEIRAAEAKRLKDFYLAKKREDKSLTQERIADLCGWAGQSVVSQYLNGKIPLNFNALSKFSNVLGFSYEQVSPRLARFIKYPVVGAPFSMDLQEGDLDGPPSASAHALIPIEEWDDKTPLDPDEVELPFFKEVELSAGKGSEVMLETNGRMLRFGKRTLQKKGIDPNTAGCVPVHGNSMEPVLPDGSTVGVDTAVTAIQDGKMYAIDHDGQLRVKVLYRLPGSGLRLRSYNAEEHPDERYDGDYVRDHIRVIGKVFWYSVLL
ncbi:putative transcriptional regulator [Pseudomonas syringae pv. aptata]|nr:putative transcriptional regulator [Pseudomonas syringae pv. pisi]RMU72255.1 putative transcriptional regulator [Pseudomonas syringae pv. aptata]RMV73522.1 hypothetical protein ALP06_200233 [Pseudomonas coronafaciens pv. atropurpurea]